MKSLTNIEKVLKVKCEIDFLFFTRYIYKENQRRNFIIAPHFVIIAKALEKVYNGETKRLIINIPPRYGKTELAVKCFIAWSLAKNPQSKVVRSKKDALLCDLCEDYPSFSDKELSEIVGLKVSRPQFFIFESKMNKKL